MRKYLLATDWLLITKSDGTDGLLHFFPNYLHDRIFCHLFLNCITFLTYSLNLQPLQNTLLMPKTRICSVLYNV